MLNTEFGVEGKISISILRKLEEGVKNLFKKAADGADKALSKVQKELENAKKVFDKAVNVLRDAEGGVSHARGEVASTQRKLDNLRSRLDSICRFRTCRQGKLLNMYTPIHAHCQAVCYILTCMHVIVLSQMQGYKFLKGHSTPNKYVAHFVELTVC